jgi:hypothetical protein
VTRSGHRLYGVGCSGYTNGMAEEHEREHRADEERDRATSEHRATPVSAGRTPFHGGDVPDALRPEEPVDPPLGQGRPERDPDDEGLPTEGHPA